MWCGTLITLALAVSGQFVPDNDDYQDDLSFLDVAVDRGENARLCDQLMRMAFIGNVMLVGVVCLVWGVYGRSVSEFYSRNFKRPVAPAE